jgi:hypothetical protein
MVLLQISNEIRPLEADAAGDFRLLGPTSAQPHRYRPEAPAASVRGFDPLWHHGLGVIDSRGAAGTMRPSHDAGAHSAHGPRFPRFVPVNATLGVRGLWMHRRHATLRMRRMHPARAGSRLPLSTRSDCSGAR